MEILSSFIFQIVLGLICLPLPSPPLLSPPLPSSPLLSPPLPSSPLLSPSRKHRYMSYYYRVVYCRDSSTQQFTSTPPYHHHITTISPPYHHHITTISPLYHHHITTISPPYHHHITTISLPYHHHITTISPPYHYHITTISLPYHHYITTISLPYHHHITTISLPYHHHITTISLPYHHHITTTSRYFSLHFKLKFQFQFLCMTYRRKCGQTLITAFLYKHVTSQFIITSPSSRLRARFPSCFTHHSVFFLNCYVSAKAIGILRLCGGLEIQKKLNHWSCRRHQDSTAFFFFVLFIGWYSGHSVTNSPLWITIIVHHAQMTLRLMHGV